MKSEMKVMARREPGKGHFLQCSSGLKPDAASSRKEGEESGAAVRAKMKQTACWEKIGGAVKSIEAGRAFLAS